MENSKINEIIELSKDKSKLGYNVIVIIAILLSLGYFYAVFFGNTSIFTLFHLEDRKEQLDKEYNTLQNENQKLQKKYFELRQLTPDADAF